ncbi:MAG: restriction endonuclease subunit S [Bacteroidales bacterium]
MSNVEELIQQLCPNGVMFVELGKLGIFYGGLTGKSKIDFENGNAKFITYMNVFSNIAVKTDIDDYVKISGHENQNEVKFGDVLFTGSSETPDECGMSSVLNEMIDEPLYLNSFCFGFRLNDKRLFLPDFLKYLFRDVQVRKQIGQTASGVTRFNISKKRFAKIQIPIPPLPIQQEIVNILDKFTSLEAELEAELEARKKQYEYYRNALLNFEGKEVEWKTLGEVCLKTENIKWKENQNSFFQYIDLSSVSRENNKITETQIINSENAPSRAQQIVNKDDVIFGTTRPTLKRYSLVTSEYNNQICSTGFCVLRANKEILLSKFLFFILTTSAFYNYIEFNQEGAGYPSISNSAVKKFPIPIPSITEQHRIVGILDKFDALVNDISIGLPAEKVARRKQYEYYRGKLLDFKPLTQ